MDISSYKRSVEQQVVEIIATAIEQGTLQEADLPQIADYVLPHIAKVKNFDQIIGFLAALSMKWPIFSSIAVQEEAKLRSHLEKQVAQNVLQLISKNQTQQAIQLARSYIK